MGVSSIRTQRLELIPASEIHLQAGMDDHDAFRELLKASVPDNWPSEDLREVLPLFRRFLVETPELFGWLVYHWVYDDRTTGRRTLIGDGGFKTLPQPDGSIEIGYGILPQFYGRGFATEGARALINMAFRHESVRCIVGQTLPDNAASIRVLEKLGFGCKGTGSEPGHLRYELLRQA